MPSGAFPHVLEIVFGQRQEAFPRHGCPHPANVIQEVAVSEGLDLYECLQHCTQFRKAPLVSWHDLLWQRLHVNGHAQRSVSHHEDREVAELRGNVGMVRRGLLQRCLPILTRVRLGSAAACSTGQRGGQMTKCFQRVTPCVPTGSCSGKSSTSLP